MLAGSPDMADVLATRPLFSDRFVLVAAAENDCVGETLTFDQFCSLPYVELRLGTNFMSVPDLTLERQPRRPRAQGWMPTPQTAMAAASGSKAVAIVPKRLFAMHRAGLRLKSVELPFEVPAINQICIWHPRNDTDPGHRWFLDLLSAQAPA